MSSKALGVSGGVGPWNRLGALARDGRLRTLLLRFSRFGVGLEGLSSSSLSWNSTVLGRKLDDIVSVGLGSEVLVDLQSNHVGGSHDVLWSSVDLEEAYGLWSVCSGKSS